MLKKNRVIAGVLIECGFVFALMALLFVLQLLIMR